MTPPFVVPELPNENPAGTGPGASGTCPIGEGRHVFADGARGCPARVHSQGLELQAHWIDRAVERRLGVHPPGLPARGSEPPTKSSKVRSASAMADSRAERASSLRRPAAHACRMIRSNAATLVALAVPATYLAMVAIERLGTGWRWPERRGWQLTGVQCFLLLGSVNALVSTVLSHAFPQVHLFDGAALGVAAGTAVGYFVVSLGNAALHGAYHRFDVLWRHVHQLHHAPARLDVAGVMYQSPWEMAANAVMFFVATRLLLGLDPLATLLCAYLAAFYGMFQHFNIRTPRWLGVFIQRPEAHCEHHRRGVHAGNYSDLPLWDLLAGTWHNPEGFEGELGFEPEAAARVGDMLRGRDVNARADGLRA
jgi:sterol desaturase/sphingolipid hydroxylase (fatty acid hydroxylase superfamily)